MKLFLTFILIGLSIFVYPQEGFQFVNPKADKVELKFKSVNNLVVIPIIVNNVSLDFLLDTGVSETILFSLADKEVNFNHVEKLKFSGLGDNIDIEALKSINNTFSIDNKMIDKTHNLYIILDESFNISTSLGVPINGIIGYHFFKNHPIEIDYVRERIIIYQSQQKASRRTRKHQAFDVSIEQNKPYMQADIEMTNEKKTSKMLLDSGNSDSIWLFPSLILGFNYNRPNIDDYLGAGFNGDIYGKRSRIHGLYFGKFQFITPLVAMPDAASISHLQLVPNRKGSIGAEIFRRFNMLFDYPNKKIYFKKNKYYNEPFIFDMSGLEVKQDGLSWEKDLVKVETKAKDLETQESQNIIYNTTDFQYKFSLKPKFIVAGTRKDSEAQKIGLKKGDVLIKINNRKTSDMTLSKINQILKSQEGKTLQIHIERNGISLIYNLILKDPIPYEEQ
ncbi:PDZ domain-containing protein [Soonwooa purpurea]